MDIDKEKVILSLNIRVKMSKEIKKLLICTVCTILLSILFDFFL